jgi:hypothetical protein
MPIQISGCSGEHDKSPAQALVRAQDGKMAIQAKAVRAAWRIGRRVYRKHSEERGIIVAANGQIKVKWDSGRTSYFRRDKRANLHLEKAVQ